MLRNGRSAYKEHIVELLDHLDTRGLYPGECRIATERGIE